MGNSDKKAQLKQYLDTFPNRPHVVILGAGASVAVIPNGDKFGRKISVMDGFIDNLGMRDLLKGIEFKSENLEDIYSELSEHPEYDDVREELEVRIRNYFKRYRLPDEPTIYDLLLLSLKKKDVVATFNWDPLLPHALTRVSKITDNLPDVLFLHGNVAVNFCEKDDLSILTPNKSSCPECGAVLNPCKLLYPVQKKNYNFDSYIASQWDSFRTYLGKACLVTIFGYNAPSSDVDAVSLMLDAWGGSKIREWEEFEIIDIKSNEELREKWDAFICKDHYRTHSSFYDSFLAGSPRRSAENFHAAYINGEWLNLPEKLHPGMTWEEINSYFAPILAEEKEMEVQYE